MKGFTFYKRHSLKIITIHKNRKKAVTTDGIQKNLGELRTRRPFSNP
jgi:hypothetical protein